MSTFPRVYNGFFRQMIKYLPIVVLFFLGLTFYRCEGGQVIHAKPVILKVFPHDTAAFTQGLLYFNGLIYESTGLVGQSSLRSIDPITGNVLKKIPIPDLFAEGLARMGMELVQLTWQEEIALVYSLPDLAQNGSYRYNGEGWGLASDSSSFIMSNGSDTLYVRSKTFAVLKKIPVTLQGNPVKNLNELEYVHGRVYANVWHSSDIVAITFKTGLVEQVIDCSLLLREARIEDSEHVLNGIAYNPRTKTFLVTGKKWPVMFEVKW
jgi:glutaminyl-peptide cyclotransferase